MRFKLRRLAGCSHPTQGGQPGARRAPSRPRRARGDPSDRRRSVAPSTRKALPQARLAHVRSTADITADTEVPRARSNIAPTFHGAARTSLLARCTRRVGPAGRRALHSLVRAARRLAHQGLNARSTATSLPHADLQKGRAAAIGSKRSSASHALQLRRWPAAGPRGGLRAGPVAAKTRGTRMGS